MSLEKVNQSYSFVTESVPSLRTINNLSYSGLQTDNQTYSLNNNNSNYLAESVVVVGGGNSSGQNCKFMPPIALDQYKLNNDPNPEVIRKRPTEKIKYIQDVSFRFLEPPQAPKHGDIIIKQLPNRQIAPAPPLIVQQSPPKQPNPPPLVLREVPPPPPSRIPEQLVLVPGKVIAPPARKVVIERLPQIPPKPEQIFIEKWLPFKQQKRRVVYQPAEPECVLPSPRNMIIQWDAPEIEVTREYKNLGTSQAQPDEYIRKYGNELIKHEEFISTARKLGAPESVLITDTHRDIGLPELEGDIEALRLVDIQKVGLSEYAQYLSSLGVSYNQSAFNSEQSPYGFVNSTDLQNLISIDQAQRIANDLNASIEKPTSESDLVDYFKSIDKNGDGLISFDEFKNATL